MTDDYVLVERDGELDQVDGRLRRAVTGDGSLVFVRGPAGTGKSGLLAACARLAAQADVTVLPARCCELERDFTHGVARQLFERAVLGLEPDARDRVLAGAARRAIEVTLSAERAPAEDGPASSEFAAMHSLYWLAANLAAERPAMLVVDDAHWADRASLRFLIYLVNRLAGLPLLVLVAARSDDPATGEELMQTLAAVASSVLEPAQLSLAGSTRIVREHMAAGARGGCARSPAARAAGTCRGALRPVTAPAGARPRDARTRPVAAARGTAPRRPAAAVGDRRARPRVRRAGAGDERQRRARRADSAPAAVAVQRPESLTASERRIAAMAAEGHSNPQIAQALFVTSKTVENHLGRVYIKLAISSRGQLRDALREPVAA